MPAIAPTTASIARSIPNPAQLKLFARREKTTKLSTAKSKADKMPFSQHFSLFLREKNTPRNTLKIFIT